MIPAFLGLKGPLLTEQEVSFFRDVKPAGFILFRRNIESPDQVRRLTQSLRDCAIGGETVILIDQEGGRVQRMLPPFWPKYPPMAVFGKMAETDPVAAAEALRLNCLLIADDLRNVGINTDCLPLLDVPVGGSDNIIGDRAYSSRKEIVCDLGRVTVDAFQEAGILPVIKHIPGHGRARVDSHKALPVVDEPVDVLRQTDFVPFRAMNHAPFAMTAHILYTALDKHNPATMSADIIKTVIRGEMGFQGLLMSDDLSMEALSGTHGERASSALNAGCDLVLHCNGDMAEMKDIVDAVADMNETIREKLALCLEAVKIKPTCGREQLENDYRKYAEHIKKLEQTVGY